MLYRVEDNSRGTRAHCSCHFSFLWTCYVHINIWAAFEWMKWRVSLNSFDFLKTWRLQRTLTCCTVLRSRDDPPALLLYQNLYSDFITNVTVVYYYWRLLNRARVLPRSRGQMTHSSHQIYKCVLLVLVYKSQSLWNWSLISPPQLSRNTYKLPQSLVWDSFSTCKHHQLISESGSMTSQIETQSVKSVQLQ